MLTEVDTHNDTDIKVSRILDKCPRQIKYSLHQKLIQDAQSYIQRKKREQDKKERVKKMQQNYEKQTQKKRQNLKNKISKSQIVQQKNMQLISKKIKKNSQHFKSVVDKICHKNEQDLQRKLILRKQIYNDESRTFSKTSKDHLNGSRTLPLRISQNDVQKKLQSINKKVKRAQNNHHIYKKQIIDRIRSKSKLIQGVKQKAIEMSIYQQQKTMKQCYQRSKDKEMRYQRAKSLNDKGILQKRKRVKEKIDKCNQNLRLLSYADQQKFIELQKKFQRKSKPKQWKDERQQKYWSKWTQNIKRIQLQKQQKAQYMINKHYQSKLKNKLYKQKKQKLIQALKKQIQ